MAVVGPHHDADPCWVEHGELQLITAEIGGVTIEAIVKRYRHDEGQFWEYSIHENKSEKGYATSFSSDEEAREAALEAFKTEVKTAADGLNTKLK